MAGGASVETVPTIGLNVKMVKKGSVNMKCWDIGGQSQYSTVDMHVHCTPVQRLHSLNHTNLLHLLYSLLQETSGVDTHADVIVSFSWLMHMLYVLLLLAHMRWAGWVVHVHSQYCWLVY